MIFPPGHPVYLENPLGSLLILFCDHESTDVQDSIRRMALKSPRIGWAVAHKDSCSSSSCRNQLVPLFKARPKEVEWSVDMEMVCDAQMTSANSQARQKYLERPELQDLT